MTTLSLPPRGFRGELLEPTDVGYAAATTIHNAMHARRPSAVARVTGPGDVAIALRHARDRGLPVSVRGGGHHVAGYAIADGGLVIDTSPMRDVAVDPARRVVRAGAGALWRHLDAATQAYGLAVTGGRDGTTGVVGQALGSGSGWLERRLGLTGDHVEAIELVTVDGEALRVTADSDPELLWGLCGAGANFGVVTAVELRLHPVGPVVHGGMLMFADADRAAVLRGWRDHMDAAGELAGTAVALVTAPDGARVAGMFVVWSGDEAGGIAHADELRALGTPVVDTVQPLPYVEAQRMLEPVVPWGMREYWKAENVPALTDAAIDALVTAHDACPSPLTQVVIEPKGGAIARRDEAATAVGARSASHCWFAFGMWEDASDDERNIAWARGTADAMAPFGMPAIAPNFIEDEGTDRLRAAFGPEKYARLQALKRRWDPENVLRSCANVRP